MWQTYLLRSWARHILMWTFVKGHIKSTNNKLLARTRPSNHFVKICRIWWLTLCVALTFYQRNLVLRATRLNLVNVWHFEPHLWTTKLLPGHDHLYNMYKYAGPDEIYPLSVTLTFELRTWVLRATCLDVVNICVK